MRSHSPIAIAALVVSLLLGTGCAREPTTADVIAANQDGWLRVTGRIAKIKATLAVMPDVREDNIDIGERPPPRFDAAPAPAGNALTLPWEGLDDLTRVPVDPLGLARRDALHHLASFQERGIDLDGYAHLPVDTVSNWFAHVTSARYILIVKVDKYETPSWIMDTLIPGRVQGVVHLFDLQEGRPLGGYRINVVSVAPEGRKLSDLAMVSLLRRDAILAIRAGIEAVPGARAPFGDLLN